MADRASGAAKPAFAGADGPAGGDDGTAADAGFGPLVGPEDWRDAEWIDDADGDDDANSEVSIILDGNGGAALCSINRSEDGNGWEWSALDIHRDTWDGHHAKGKADTREAAREAASQAVPSACVDAMI